MIDTHAHLFDERFASDLPAVLQRAADAGLERIVCIGIDRDSNLPSVKLANSHPMLVAVVGIQPNGVLQIEGRSETLVGYDVLERTVSGEVRPVWPIGIARLRLRPGVVSPEDTG